MRSSPRADYDDMIPDDEPMTTRRKLSLTVIVIGLAAIIFM